MKRAATFFFFLFFAFLQWVPSMPCLFAEETLTPKEIIKRQDDLLQGDSMQGHYAMTVVTPEWQRRLELNVWSKGRDETFIRILSPAKEAGTGTLRIKQNMWNYLPKVERTIKVPPSLMLQAWMGSDFSNDDIVNESSIVNDYTHELIGEEELGGAKIWRIEVVPKPGKAVNWGKIIYSVQKEGFIPLREEYFDEHGKKIKVLEYSNIKKMSDRTIPTLWKMTPLTKKGHETVIEILDVTYNQPIASDVFTMENLKKSQ